MMKHELPKEVADIGKTMTPEQVEKARLLMQPFVDGIITLIDENVKTSQDFLSLLGAFGFVIASLFASMALSVGEEATEKELETWIAVLRSATGTRLDEFKDDPVIAALRAGSTTVGHA